jgi:hypothetical protein
VTIGSSLGRGLLLVGLALAFAGCGGEGGGDAEPGAGSIATAGGSDETARFEIDNAKQFVLFAAGNDPASALTVTHDYIEMVSKHVDTIGAEAARAELAQTADELRGHCGKCVKALERAQSEIT